MVTGASGFIGRWTLQPLVDRGFEVHALHQRGAPLLVDGVKWHHVDLLAPNEAARVISGLRPSHLLHLAWYAVHRQFWTSAENLRWVGASVELLRAFRDAGGVRMVTAGTCAEYDARHGWCSENVTPLGPGSLYGAAKDSLRRLVEAFSQQEHISWAWGRVFHLFGPHETSTRLVPSVVHAMLRGHPTQCSDGTQVRDFMHVKDVACAFAALLDSSVEGAVNIASGESHSLRELVELVAQEVGTPHLARFGALPTPPGDPPFLVADARRLRQELNFRPTHTLATGVADVVNWWRGELAAES